MMMMIIIINIIKQEYLKHKWIANADYVNSLTGQYNTLYQPAQYWHKKCKTYIERYDKNYTSTYARKQE